MVAALRCYAREGCMPLLGTDPAGFVLSTANGGSGALKEDEKITFNGCRSFLLWQKDAVQGATNHAGPNALTATRAPAGRAVVASRLLQALAGKAVVAGRLV